MYPFTWLNPEEQSIPSPLICSSLGKATPNIFRTQLFWTQLTAEKQRLVPYALATALCFFILLTVPIRARSHTSSSHRLNQKQECNQG